MSITTRLRDVMVTPILPYISDDGGVNEPPLVSRSWEVTINEIVSNPNVRLDARHFDPTAAIAVQEMRNAGLELQPLADLASVELRNQFTRIWAKDSEHGLPYLNATDLLSLFALGMPAGGVRYLSYATETDIQRLIVREGWLLMTCSGTIGRVFYVPKRLDGWVATHDLIRIVPERAEMVGYLYAYLSTHFAQDQIVSHTHGGQIDHVTDAQVASCFVPILSEDKIDRIHAKVMDALLLREETIITLTDSWPLK